MERLVERVNVIRSYPCSQITGKATFWPGEPFNGPPIF